MYCTKVAPATMLPYFEGLSPLEEWDIASFGCTEESIIEYIDFYNFPRCNPIMKVRDSPFVRRLDCPNSSPGVAFAVSL